MPSDGKPPNFDTSVAHVARVYDYWLGATCASYLYREVTGPGRTACQRDCQHTGHRARSIQASDLGKRARVATREDDNRSVRWVDAAPY